MKILSTILWNLFLLIVSFMFPILLGLILLMITHISYPSENFFINKEFIYSTIPSISILGFLIFIFIINRKPFLPEDVEIFKKHEITPDSFKLPNTIKDNRKVEFAELEDKFSSQG